MTSAVHDEATSRRVQERALEFHRLDPEWRVAALGRASLLPLDAEDTRKARDAIIVAIGISSVLIINVAYLGYITPPGGPDPYWADCFYPVFVAFFVLNGFALVFSVAALCAVTWGPFVLIWCKLSTWRTRVVNLGLVHLAVSLASLLGAFACAGFVTASVGAPDLTCGNLRCIEGGVPCYSFSYIRGAKHIPFHGNAWRPWTYTLSPALAKLNNATFGNVKSTNPPPSGEPFMSADSLGQDVYCHSYSAVATFSGLGCMTGSACAPTCNTQFDGLHGGGALDDADGKPVNRTCLVLIDQSSLGLPLMDHWSPFTYWCSASGSELGPGWLPLRLEAAALLLETADLGYYFGRDFNMYSSTSDGYAVQQGPCLTSCPVLPGFQRPIPSRNDAPGLNFTGLHLRGVELLGQLHSAWTATGPAMLDSAGSCTSFKEFAGVAPVEYVQALVGYYAGWRNCRIDVGVPIEAKDGNTRKSTLGKSAAYYPSLQYQCQSGYQGIGVLCDCSVNPPLSVDTEGNFIDKKSLSKLSNARFASLPWSLTTHSVEYAVVAMLAVAFVAIFGTLAGLGGTQVAYKGLQNCKAFICGRVFGHVVGASGAAVD